MQPTPRDQAWNQCLEDLCRILDGRLTVRRGGIVRRGPVRELWCECAAAGGPARRMCSPPAAPGIWRARCRVPRGVGVSRRRRGLRLAVAQLVVELAFVTGLGLGILAPGERAAAQEVTASCEVSS